MKKCALLEVYMSPHEAYVCARSTPNKFTSVQNTLHLHMYLLVHRYIQHGK